MYQELFQDFENTKNLAGKAWEHAIAIDLLNNSNIQGGNFCYFIQNRQIKISQRFNSGYCLR